MGPPREAILICASCQKQYRVPDYDSSKRYRCRNCSAVLATAAEDRTEIVHPDDEVPLPEEVYHAAKDPKKRFGRFILVSELGRGGMGVVTKAWDEQLSRWAAIKFITPDSTVKEDLARFKREAKLAANLDHPNIAPIFDVGESEGRHYIVMKFVDGTTLNRAGLKQIPELVRAVRDAARAVGHAHAHGIIHRDIKPQNLMVDRSGRVYVMDFGLAKSLQHSNAGLTASYTVLGTPAFMAPEQARGLPKELDARTDVYSLATTLWTLVAGRHPHTAESAQDLMVRIATEPPPDLRTARPDAPAALESILRKAMSMEKADRFRTANEFADALDHFLEHPSATSEEFVPTVRADPPVLVPARGKKWPAVGVFVALLVAAAAAVAWHKMRRPEPAPPVLPPDHDTSDGWLQAVEIARAKAEARDTVEEWQNVLDLLDKARARAPGEKERAEIDTQAEEARFFKKWAEARESEARGDIPTATRLANVALASSGKHRSRLEAYIKHLNVAEIKKALEQLKAEARAAKDPAAALEAWKRARDAARDTVDIAEAEAEIAKLEGEDRYRSLLREAEEALSAKNFDLASVKFTEALRLRPSDPEPAQGLQRVEAARQREAYNSTMAEGLAAEKAGEWEKAKQAYERALASKPGDTEANKALTRINGFRAKKKIDAVLAEAQAAEEAGDWAKAKEACDLALKIATEEGAAALVKLGIRNRRAYIDAMEEAQIAEKAGEWEKAKAACDRALKARPGDEKAAAALRRIKAAARPERIEVWLDEAKTIRIEFVRLDPGIFMMGSEEGGSDEKPVRETKISRDFWLQTTEVTQRQWMAIMGKNPSTTKGDSFPVQNISWDEAQEFLKKLNEKVKGQTGGRAFRLPTEAEWEYACRAGSDSRWCFGNDEAKLDEYAWYERNSGQKPREVGTRKANDWGFYDMHGNVYEWVEDRFGAYVATKTTDPVGPTAGDKRVARGGGILQNSRYLRSAYRLALPPETRYFYVGLRLALR